MTEQYTTTTAEVRELIAEAREWASSYASWGDNGLVDRLVDALELVRTERDAAVAAIERVRAIVSDPCSEGCCDFCEGKNEGWEMVLQALDGGDFSE